MMPGGFYSDSYEDGGLSPTTEARLAALVDEDGQPAFEIDTSEEDDGDYNPDARRRGAREASTTESDDIDFDDDDDDDDDDEDDEGAMVIDGDDDDGEGTETGGGAGGGGGDGPALRIAFDPSSRQVLLLDGDGNATRLTQTHLAGTGTTLAAIQRMILSQLTGRRAIPDDDDEDEVDEDEDEDVLDDPYWGPSRRTHKKYYDIPTEPVPAGVRLERSGEFGSPPPKYAAKERKFVDYSPNLASKFRAREIHPGRMPKRWLAHDAVPNTPGVEVSQLQSKVYSGQYSTDGAFFYAAAQDFKIYVYDTRDAPRTGDKSVIEAPIQPRRSRMYGSMWEHRTSLKVIKTVQANAIACQWTVTDASLSVDNEWMLYSSITPYVHLVKTGGGNNSGVWDLDETQEMLDFSNGGMRSFGIWSIRFSNDGNEIVAGASSGQIFVYDIETKKSVLRVSGHQDDVNAVAFADSASSNVVLSGSDDTFVKVWDRRSMSGQRASGTLVGHTEGITFVAPKGDGRYCISNGKDQGTKLWDLRKMTSNEDFDRLRLDRKEYGIPGWDYRQSFYSKPKYKQHPHDCSVMTYRGHAVLRTLIRCHFSPASTTDQQYIYSGSSDGKIHIWSLDGMLVQKIDRKYTHPLINSETGDYNDPADGELRAKKARGGGSIMVRDVAWHPYRPELMSTAWGQGGVEGNIARHEWRGALGESLEDRLERERLEAMEGA